MYRAVKTLLEYMTSTQATFKVALMVEPFMDEAAQLAVEEKQKLVDYVWDTFYSQYPDLLLEWDGRPLLGTFSPLDLSQTEDSRVTFRMSGSSNDPDWKTYQPFDWNGYPDVGTLEMQISEDGVIIVFPRFDEYWAWLMGWKAPWDPRRVDSFLTEGAYERAWQACVDNRDKLDMIIVYSWNEHGDHSAIEPAKEGNPTAAGWEYYRRFLAEESIEGIGGPIPSPTWTPAATATPFEPPAHAEGAPLLGALWYPVHGYDRDTGECMGGLGTSGWNEKPGGPPVVATPWLGFYCFGQPSCLGMDGETSRLTAPLRQRTSRPSMKTSFAC